MPSQSTWQLSLYQLFTISRIISNFEQTQGPKGIRINGIAPGAIKGTEGVDRLSGGNTEQDMVKYTPLQRMGVKDDIAALQIFLMSEAASYITGQTIVCDGGAVLAMPNFTMTFEPFIKSWIRPKL